MKYVSLKTVSADGVLALLLIACAACGKKDTARTAFDTGVARPDTYPVMLNKDMPFRYPPALYAEKVQGNVTLRLYVDTAGAVVNDSTKVVESSKSAMLDSAAIIGARELRFACARLHGAPMPVSILFPVYFRHPEAPPPAGDTILKKVPVPAADSAAARAKDTAKSNRSNSSGTAKSSSGRRRRNR
ncbi:MAG: energy transducer TonB [Gemmatimonadaceae bacterium]